MTVFNARTSVRSRSRRRLLAFEQYENRLMMSGAPVATAAFESGPDGELEALANFDLSTSRRFMMETLAKFVYKQKYASPSVPLVGPYGGSLVITGSPLADNIQVEEYPARFDQRTHMQRPAEYVVTIRGPGAKNLAPIPPIPLTAVPNRLVVIFGLGQNDVIKFVTASPSQTKVFVDGGAGADTITGGPNGDFLDGGVADASIDKIYGGKGDDMIAGGAGNDLLFGDADADLMFGEVGVDTMRGGAGKDEMYGGDNNDTMYGDSENDLLFGGKGLDTLNGEGGVDYLSGGQDGIADVLVGGSEIDGFRYEGSVANNKDKPRKPEEKEQIVANYTQVKWKSLAPKVSFTALDAGFEGLGVRLA